jgi:hypothetical protein
MLTQLEVRTAKGDILTLPFNDATAGYVFQDAQGLDPVKATLVSSSFAQQDGVQYQSSRREARNIILTLGLEPDWTVDDVASIRRRLYNYLMPKSAITMHLTDDSGLEVDISGRVESFENTLFSQEPSVDVSVICFDPDFTDPDPVTITGSSTSGTFKAPFTYDGTVDTGILFKLMVNRSLSEFTIYHTLPDGSVRTMDFVAPLISGDVVTISTIPGNKYARLTRASVDSSLLYAVAPQASWIALEEGDNTLRIYATGAAIPYSIVYTNRYGGL